MMSFVLSRLCLFWKISPNDSRVERGESVSHLLFSQNIISFCCCSAGTSCWCHFLLLISLLLFNFLTRSLYLFRNFSIFSSHPSLFAPSPSHFNHRYILSYLSELDNKIDWLSEHEGLFWTSRRQRSSSVSLPSSSLIFSIHSSNLPLSRNVWKNESSA